MVNVIGFVGLGVCGFSLVCALLALALPYWISGTVFIRRFGSFDVHSGLFQSCSSITNGETTCNDVLKSVTGSLKDSFRACQAMVLMGFFAIVGSLVSIILLLFVMKDRKLLGYIGAGLAFGGGLLLMIGMAIYVDKINSNSDNYSAGFAFDILGWLSAWAAGGIMAFMILKGSTAS